ncbi:RNA-binding protein 4.1-like [Tribolium madens]|uniref:RNA-binding protein 4.1-like n=1 Tax=Tribolium madens TaxID=41895 RepID=UPI001CF73195|nr:RNA-binding protein 4.1-like [Tribolium madens]XP_044265849.1 RNA-binding protein 4.1-like [Tribolium madens]
MSRRSETTTKVFVGSLPNGVTTDDLRALFAPYGAIAECDIANRCGFLHLEDHDLAMKAIAELNGTNFMGGRISVEKGRVKPRRGPGGGGPMRGGKDRGGPYARGDFRGPPHRNGGFGGGRDYPPYGGGDRFGGYDRPPQRGGYDGGYGDRRPPYDDRRGAGFGAERRPFSNDFDRRPYGDARPGGFPEVPRVDYDDRRPPAGEFDDRRPLLNDRRPLLDQQGPPPPRGPAGFDRGAPVPELYSRRDQVPKPMGGAGGFPDRGGYGTASANGYTAGYGSPAAPPTGGYGTPAPPTAGYGTGAGTFGSPAPQGGYNDARGYGTAAAYGTPGGYGDTYGAGAGGRGSYDAAYPPLPQQRGGKFWSKI